ncbi:hypothetical protein M3Y98_00518500 [Aphelenchoides besseyi]|nr:hypothetical protein M3Y98_00518500 [Aphelenchoides besseyi]KAI6207922.1 hypothetical protein M3Y96_00060100 [Aphelenchoides besseyi]
MKITTLLTVILLSIVTITCYADCGCGSRCARYDSDLQCARCCTATVRRSVPIVEPEYTMAENVNDGMQDTRKRSYAELKALVSLLKQNEQRTSSSKMRVELHRARKRLERYGQAQYSDLSTSHQVDSIVKLDDKEKDMYGVLERILRQLVRRPVVDLDQSADADSTIRRHSRRSSRYLTV